MPQKQADPSIPEILVNLDVNFHSLISDLGNLQPGIFKEPLLSDTLVRLADNTAVTPTVSDLSDLIIAAVAVLRLEFNVDPSIALNKRISEMEHMVAYGEAPFFNAPVTRYLPVIVDHSTSKQLHATGTGNSGGTSS